MKWAIYTRRDQTLAIPLTKCHVKGMKKWSDVTNKGDWTFHGIERRGIAASHATQLFDATDAFSIRCCWSAGTYGRRWGRDRDTFLHSLKRSAHE